MINYDWSDIAFKNKSELKDKNYIFVAGSREISEKRFAQIILQYLEKGNILIGVLKNEYINGFEGQPQFRSMSSDLINKTLKKLLSAKPELKDKIDMIEYSQNELTYIIDKIEPRKVILINGSWKRMFHLRDEFYTLIKKRIKYELISPFLSEEEAREYLKEIQESVDSQVDLDEGTEYTDVEIFKILERKAKVSFATDFQTSCALVRDGRILITAHNEVVPYETFALHFGSVKEMNFSPQNDLNHYDTNHAEMMILIKALNSKVNLNGTKLYINLMPCPTCARILSQTGIHEVVYSQDHSEGYAVKILERSGKKVRRFIL